MDYKVSAKTAALLDCYMALSESVETVTNAVETAGTFGTHIDMYMMDYRSHILSALHEILCFVNDSIEDNLDIKQEGVIEI